MANPNPPPPPEHTRFKPGESGNPAGYSKARRIEKALHELVDEKQAAKAIAQVLLRKALEGNPKFMAMLLDRVDGKSVVTLQGPNGENIGGTIHLPSLPDPEYMAQVAAIMARHQPHGDDTGMGGAEGSGNAGPSAVEPA